MATMISEVYEAFIDAGVKKEKAKAAAEALATEQLVTKGDIKNIELKIEQTKSELIKWVIGMHLGTIAIIFALFNFFL